MIESDQSYPRPPALETVPLRIHLVRGGALVAESMAALRMLETRHAPTYYLPRRDVLTPASGASFCERNGIAQYWSVDMCETRVHRAAWSYPDPGSRFADIKDHVAFYAQQDGRLFCRRRTSHAATG